MFTFLSHFTVKKNNNLYNHWGHFFEFINHIEMNTEAFYQFNKYAFIRQISLGEIREISISNFFSSSNFSSYLQVRIMALPKAICSRFVLHTCEIFRHTSRKLIFYRDLKFVKIR